MPHLGFCAGRLSLPDYRSLCSARDLGDIFSLDRSARRRHTSRLASIAARMKSANSGCGAKGFDFSSGWNWTPMNHG